MADEKTNLNGKDVLKEFQFIYDKVVVEEENLKKYYYSKLLEDIQNVDAKMKMLLLKTFKELNFADFEVLKYIYLLNEENKKEKADLLINLKKILEKKSAESKLTKLYNDAEKSYLLKASIQNLKNMSLLAQRESESEPTPTALLERIGEIISE